jgi:molecular chaperone Hsp33
MGGDQAKFAGETGASRFSDYVLPFQLEASGARGRLIRLGPVVDQILGRHSYPEPVLLLLGEAVTLTAMLGAALKFDGKFILQTQSDGPVGFLVVHYSSPGHMRGYASYNKDEVARVLSGSGGGDAALLGGGHLAMTIDPGAGMERYQGIVPLAGNTLVDAAHEYFDRSEQIPTFIRIAVARQYTAGDGGKPGGWAWRAGGLMVQKLTREGGRQESDDYSPAGGNGADDDGWRRALALASTVEDHELLDPTLSPERLLYRLFHEEEVRAFDPAALDSECNCSRERVEMMLNQFSAEELDGMAVDDAITVTCEFCTTSYKFDAERYLKTGEN